jgi:hypothetical protein
MTKAAVTSEISVNFYQTKWRSNSKDGHFYMRSFPFCPNASYAGEGCSLGTGRVTEENS